MNDVRRVAWTRLHHARGVCTISTQTDRPRVDLPDVQVDHLVARDIDLALLRLLPVGQLLGGPLGLEHPVAPEPVEPPSGETIVSLDVATDLVATARAQGGVVLRDEELTPLARFDLLEPGSETGQVDHGSLRGTLTRLRERESGHAGRDAVTVGDLWPDQVRTVIVFGRPPVASDAARLDAALAGGLDAGGGDATGREQPVNPVLAVIADDPSSTVPPQVMTDIARLWIADRGLTDVRVISAPLAWRDPETNTALAARLGRALGGSPTVFLDPDDASAAADCWQSVRAELEVGNVDSPALKAVSQPIRARLLRWRRPRTERGLVLMFSGLSGSGKSTLARDVSEWITTHSERTVSLLDGDVVRTMLSSGLGFSKTDRELNVRRIGYVGSEVARHGGIAICAPIAPYAATRDAVRTMARAVGDFLLVHVNTSLEECERRDLKGLYAKARAGLIPEFTGISDPYEPPIDADLAVDTGVVDRTAALASVVHLLESGGWLPESSHPSSTPPRKN